MATPTLSLRNITMRFGGLTAVSDLSLDVEPNGLIGLIGPNGAGKTTVFNIITGFYKPTVGEVLLEGKPITGAKPYHIARLGLSRTFQNIRLCPSLTVFQSAQVAFAKNAEYGFFHAGLATRLCRRVDAKVAKEIEETLDIFGLLPVKDEQSTSLPYGDQRRLEIVRALSTRPKALLLDEPAAGMNPSEKAALMELIKLIRERYKIAILMIEHDMKVIMGICERITALDYGVKIAEGSPAAIRTNKKVIEAYLGEEV